MCRRGGARNFDRRALPKPRTEIIRRIRMSRRIAALALAALAAAATLGCESGGGLSPISSSHAQTPQASAASAPARALPDFSALVEQYGPAVVNISTTARVRTQAQEQIPGEPGDPFYEFFRRFQIPMPQGDAIRRGVGSGFIVSADGYIFTNAHVVDDASEVTVKLTDNREFSAKVIGADRRTDVALVKIDAKNLPVVRIGDASRARVGEWVAAIGSPFGLENTVTAGIISAKSRSLPDENYVPFIQTDVAINPGNSGGPLFNMAGEVIGINSQIYSRTGGYMGLSFAVPIEVAMKVKSDLQQYGKVSRGRLGVTIQGVNQELADSFGLKKPQGALVSAVEAKSPADKAGIKTGDIVLAVDGHAIENSVDLPRIIGESRPGTQVKLKIWRQGDTRELTASLGEAPAEKMARADKDTKVKPSKLGVAVRPLTDNERNKIATEGGLLVEQAEGPAARAGVQPGDVILAFNNQPVKSVDQLRRLVDRSRGSVALLIQREGNKIYVPVRLS
jgi:serine protease Do